MTDAYRYFKAGWFVAGGLVVRRACVEVDESGRVASVGTVCPAGAVGFGDSTVLMPGLCNAHVHLLDYVAPECGEGLGLEELVSQPHGLKYRLLRERLSLFPSVASMTRLDAALAATYAELSRVDLLGGGLGACRLLVYPQPASKVEVEVLRVLRRYGRVGLDTVFDVAGFLDVFAAEAGRLGASVQVHVSETSRLYGMRDYEYAAEIPGVIMVHCTYMPGEAVAEAAEEAGVVLCPSSNAMLVGRLPDVDELLRAWRRGEALRVGIGTDNAAWNEPSVALELHTAYLLLDGWRRRGLSGLLLYAATIGGHRVLGEAEAELVAATHPAYMHTCDIVSSLVKRLASSRVASTGARLSLEEYPR